MKRLGAAILFLLAAFGPVTSATGQDRSASPSRSPAMAEDPWPGMKKLLVVADVQNGYHHDAISHTMAGDRTDGTRKAGNG